MHHKTRRKAGFLSCTHIIISTRTCPRRFLFNPYLVCPFYQTKLFKRGIFLYIPQENIPRSFTFLKICVIMENAREYGVFSTTTKRGENQPFFTHSPVIAKIKI